MRKELNKLINLIKKDILLSDESDCTCCDGTGGSVGNEDPDDDWICDCCNGTGKQNRIKLPDPPKEK